MPLLFFEFLGTSELLVIMFVALVVFGPRKLPELGRTLGRTLGEFKRASEDLKRTWDREIEMENVASTVHNNHAVLPVEPLPVEFSTAESSHAPADPVVESVGVPA